VSSLRTGRGFALCLSVVAIGLVAFAAPVPAEEPAGTYPPEINEPIPEPPPPPLGVSGAEEIPAPVPGRGWLQISHGVAAGDVTSHSAVLWARSSFPGLMNVQVDTDPGFKHPRPSAHPASAMEAEDYTASLKVDGLQPGTMYYYRIWLTSGVDQLPPLVSSPRTGSFKTAPDSATSAPVHFLWGGHLGGQSYCRRAGKGYAIFSKMQEQNPDFFIALGNMIYADEGCPRGGPDGEGLWQNEPGDFPGVTDEAISWADAGRVRDIYWKHWRYDRADRHFQRFLANTPMYSQWNDHEVLNDFGADWSYWNRATKDREGFRELVIEGRDAFFQYAPIDRSQVDLNRIYRSFRWGKDLELFLVDTRSYRSRNELPDTPANQKTMLGDEQREWLRRGLLHSTATWKVVSCDAAMSVPTGTEDGARDGWASGGGTDSTGFERELLDLLSSLDAGRVTNLVFLTSDLPWAAEIRYGKDLNGDGAPLVCYELAAGPLSAQRGRPVPLDPTLEPSLLYSEGGIFDFGSARVVTQADGKAHFMAEIRGDDGEIRPGSALDLVPLDASPASGRN
jgi:alkaline phosphatase D